MIERRTVSTFACEPDALKSHMDIVFVHLAIDLIPINYLYIQQNTFVPRGTSIYGANAAKMCVRSEGARSK